MLTSTLAVLTLFDSHRIKLSTQSATQSAPTDEGQPQVSEDSPINQFPATLLHGLQRQQLEALGMNGESISIMLVGEVTPTWRCGAVVGREGFLRARAEQGRAGSCEPWLAFT